MGILENFRDRFIVKPVADKIMTEISKAEQPAVYQVPFGFNQTTTATNKQFSMGSVDARILRNISVTHETTRACINVRKRQITQLDFDIVEVDAKPDEEEASQTQREAIKRQIMAIGGQGVKFRSLLNKLIEDLLVLDGFVFYKQRTRGGRLARIVPVDPATIKIRVDENGALPMPPDVAYEQWIYGKKVADMTTDDLTYEMMNPRSNSPYGLSPIESAVLAVDASMRATIYNTNYLNDNNIPMGFLGMPEGWTVQQIKEYKEWFDAMMTGSKNTSKVFPIPAGTQYTPATKPSDFAFKDFFDYLDRKICMLFDVTPQEIGLSLQQYKENAEEQGKIQIRRGIRPLANFIEEIFTEIIQTELGFTKYKFAFSGIEGGLSVDDIDKLVKIGVISGDEAREEIGRASIGYGNTILGFTATKVEDVGEVTDAVVVEDEPKEDVEPEKMDDDDQKPPENTEKLQNDGEISKKMSDSNKKMDEMEANQKFTAFMNATQKELEKQMAPFTDPDVVAPIMDISKAYDPNIEYEVEQIMQLVGLKDYEKFAKWGIEEGVKEARTQLGLTSTFTLTNRRFVDILGDREKLLIDSVNNTSKEMLARIMSEGKTKGLTNEQVAKQIRDQMPEIAKKRSEVIARTEIAHSVENAKLDEYKRRNIKMKRWVVVEDIGDQCGEYAKMGAIPLEQEFEPGVMYPPAHPNCRCYHEPVIGDIDL